MPDINLSGLNSSYLSGTTAQRPASSNIGALYFNTDLGCLQIYTSIGWFVYQNPAVPLAPTNVVATDQGSGRAYNNGQASVAFTPTSTGGVASSFTVTSSPGSYTGTGSSSPITITGLQSSTQYAYTVTATNLLATSSASSASSGVTATTVPQAPSLTASSAAESANITITPGATGGSAITQYTIISDPATTTQTTSDLSYIFTGLTDGTAYTFTATATNANGTSAASAASNSVTPNSWSPEGAYDALATVSLSTPTASINFYGIPSGYKHLQIRASFLGDTATGYDAIIRFNSDTSSSYNWHRLYGTGNASVALAQGTSTATAMYLAADATRTLYPSVSIVDILDYSSDSKFKTLRNLNGFDQNGGGAITLWSGLWRRNDYLSDINISVVSNNFAVGSSFALYGVK